MTFGEARAAFPGKHLFWHTRAKCWNASRSAAAAHMRQPPLPSRRPAESPRILFPDLVSGPAPDPRFLGRDMSSEPLLIDIDEATAEPPECCWPPLDEPPPATFTERWLAMPPAWILASKTP
jgi:hypothetical protein